MKKILFIILLLSCITVSAASFNKTACAPFFGVWETSNTMQGVDVNAKMTLESNGKILMVSNAHYSDSKMTLQFKFTVKGTWKYEDGVILFDWDSNTFTYDPTGTSQNVLNSGIVNKFVPSEKNRMLKNDKITVFDKSDNSFSDQEGNNWTKTQSVKETKSKTGTAKKRRR